MPLKASIAILFCVAVAGCDRSASLPIESPPHATASKPLQEAGVSTSAADAVRLKVLDYAGFERLIAGKRGQVVVVDAWSTACPPCVRDFHYLVALDRGYGARGLACVSLSFDYEGTGRPEDESPRVLEFLRKQGATFDNVLSAEQPEAMYTKLDFASVPEVFVYDRKGQLRARLQEAATGSKEKPLYDRVEMLVNSLLGEPTGK